MAQTNRLKAIPIGPDPLIADELNMEHTQHHLHQVEERNAAGGRDDADAKLVGHLDDAGR